VSSKPPPSVLCPVCYTESAEAVGMECGHFLCEDCYREYLKESVKKGPDCVFTLCPFGGMGDPKTACKLIVPL